MYRTITALLLLGICGLLPIAADAEVITGVTGSGQPHTNVQPGLGINYIIALQGLFPSRNKESKDTPFLGEVSMFAGNFAPRGWAFCDGQLLPINGNEAMFSILGTMYGGDGRTTFQLPDLRGRAAVHPGSGSGLSTRMIGQRTGAEFVVLSEAQMPAHDHSLPPTSFRTDDTGGGQSHPNMQPWLGLSYTLALQGYYPSRTKDVDPEPDKGDMPFIGELNLFAGNFAPRGFAYPDGQLLQIAQNTALFSLLGTTYGGDGRTTFGLPDLRGRVAIHEGQGPGLSNRPLGQKTGVEEVTLNEAQLPSHPHTAPPPVDLTGYTGGSQPHTNMQPSLALNYIIALEGIFPSRNKDVELPEGKDAEPFIGEVSLFAGHFAPRGWAFCDGQLLQISQNSALFALLGTTYGGDGRTTFGLPDLRGRVPIHPGTGPGLSHWHLGEKKGVESVQLSQLQLWPHYHTAAQIPEPSTLVLFAVGLLGLGCYGSVRARRRAR